MTFVNQSPVGQGFVIEPLERRTLLSNWGPTATLIDQNLAYAHYRKIDGRGQTVALIDTGVDYNHSILGGGWGKRVIGGYDFVDDDADPMDQTGHGTMVAGILAGSGFTYNGQRYRGVAPGAKIVALRVADNSDFLPDSRIESALKWVLRNRKRFNITAVNLSLGDGDFSHKATRQPYGDELAALRRAGVFIAAASGNEGVQSPPGVNYPAADPSVSAIGSVNSNDAISKFTSRGRDLELLAPGENVPSSYINPFDGSEGYISGSGTSFATPFVAGAAMLLHQINPRLTPGQEISILKRSGVPNYDGDAESPSTGLTFRRLDLDDALAMAYDSRARRTKTARAAASQNMTPNSLPPATPASLNSSSLSGITWPFQFRTPIRRPDADFFERA